MIAWIEQLDNLDMLEALISLKKSSRTVAWDDLPEETKAGIITGRQDIQEGRFHTSEEFWEELNHRRNKRTSKAPKKINFNSNR